MADPAFLAEHVRDIPDWPRPGVVFKDITPLLADAKAFTTAVDSLAEHFGYRPDEAPDPPDRAVDKVVGVEARGFLFGAPVAYRFGVGVVPVRKAGKLPWEIEQQEYVLEYGTDVLEIHRDAVTPGERVLIVDDVLATGGTAVATAHLLERIGAEVVGLGFVIELEFLGGRAHLANYDVVSLISYA